MANSMSYIEENNLFEEAKSRYENTSRRWKNSWWSVICNIYDKCIEFRKKYELDKINCVIIERLKQIFEGIINKVQITFAKGTKKCYLFKFYDSNGELLFSKIGTTERTVEARIKEEMRTYKKSFDVCGAIIESVIDCKDIPAEGAESHLRGYFIKKYPNNYIKNDRFGYIDIDVNEFNEVVNNYLVA